jgi:DNA-binding transcriptional MocR family regulator
MNRDVSSLKTEFQRISEEKKAYSLARGNPATANLDLLTPYQVEAFQDLAARGFVVDGVDLRNYGGDSFGLKGIRRLFAEQILSSAWEQTAVYNNSSLELQARIVQWGFVKPFPGAAAPWVRGRAKAILIDPCYDRHRRICEAYGLEVLSVPMTKDGPDVAKMAAFIEGDSDVVLAIMVPMHSNPCGTTYSNDTIRSLVSLRPKNAGFRYVVDNAYAVHHLYDDIPSQVSFLDAAGAAGNPDIAFVFGSTSKITWAGSGLGAVTSTAQNMEWFRGLFESDTIGPSKIWHYVVERAISNYPGQIRGLMQAHAHIIRPKFDAVHTALAEELEGMCRSDGAPVATWTSPKGGYFLLVQTEPGLASKVIAACKDVGLTLTPAGATSPDKAKNRDTDIRLAPTSLGTPAEAAAAARVLATCIKLVSLT